MIWITTRKDGEYTIVVGKQGHAALYKKGKTIDEWNFRNNFRLNERLIIGFWLSTTRIVSSIHRLERRFIEEIIDGEKYKEI